MASYLKQNTQAQLEQERRFYRQQLDQLTNAANLGSSWGAGGAADHARSATAGGLPRSYPQRGLNVQYGETANEKQLDQYIAQQKGRGMNRGLMPGTTVMPRKGQVQRAAGLKAKKDTETDLQKFFREAEGKIEEANNANEKRRDQILSALDARYNRVMDRIQNFGGAARADLEERAQESLANIHANLSARGLGNSTILAAFQGRNQRDLAREQQRLSEQVDTRAMNADMAMTTEKTRFLENINENAPNYGQLMELAQRYGMGNDGQGYNAQQQGQQGMLTVNQGGGGGWAPPAGAVAAGRNRGPMFLNGFNPMGIANNMAGRGAGPGYTYKPTVRGTSRAKWAKKKAGEMYNPGATDLNLPSPISDNLQAAATNIGQVGGDVLGSLQDAYSGAAASVGNWWNKPALDSNWDQLKPSDTPIYSPRDAWNMAGNELNKWL